jgi:large subunit ribosomal protein L13
MSMKAIVRSSRWMIVAGIVPATIAQKRQFTPWSVPPRLLSGAPAIVSPCRGAEFLRCAFLWPSKGRTRQERARIAVSQKTYNAKPGDVERVWYVVDADGETLGRLATRIADTLRGKLKPQYTPHIDTGDFVVVVNCEQIRVTGRKMEQKKYYRHSGFPGGIKERTLAEQLRRHPDDVIRHAVRGMLPKNRIGRAQLKKLKIYAGASHPHTAQQPNPLP